MMIVGSLGSVISAGTFASFNASTTSTSSFASGSLVLGNQKGTASMCLSNGGSIAADGNTPPIGSPSVTSTDLNTNLACDSLINVTVRKPSESAIIDLTLKNHGDLPGELSGYAASACTSAFAAGQVYDGGGDPCGALQLTVQRYASATNRTSNLTTGGICVYGGNQNGQTCSFDAGKTLAQFRTDTQIVPLALGTVAAGASVYLRISILLPVGASNSLQGRQSGFDFTWQLT